MTNTVSRVNKRRRVSAWTSAHADQLNAQTERVQAHLDAILSASDIKETLAVIAYRLKNGDDRFISMEGNLKTFIEDTNKKLSDLTLQTSHVTTRFEDFIAVCAKCTENITHLTNDAEQRKGSKKTIMVIITTFGALAVTWILKLLGVIKFKF